MVAPARRLVFYRFRTWVDRIVKIAVHTFAVDADEVPLNFKDPKGYWYCAGSFCDVDDAGVSQHLISADLGLARCLVAPNIKDDDAERPQKVIAGEYGVHYVCHNITNRVLHSTAERNTLIDLDVPVTGYELVVKSVLGIYGQNKLEWQRRREACEGEPRHGTDALVANGGAAENREIRSRDDEIERIHLRAAGGDRSKARRLTEALKEIDTEYLHDTGYLVDEYNREAVPMDKFSDDMVDTTYRMFASTISLVGAEMTKKIYPNCEIEEEVEIVNEAPMSAGAA